MKELRVNKAEFKIGKERRKVDYCISDNTTSAVCMRPLSTEMVLSIS